MPVPPICNRRIEDAFRKPAVEVRTKVVRLSEQARKDVSRIPTYLKLAEIGGKARFTTEETNAITKAFSEYCTDICRTDLVKDLLNIGTKEGTPLSTSEIINYLHISTNLGENEQMNILNFIGKCKTKLKKKVIDFGKITEQTVDTKELFSREKGLDFIRIAVVKCDNPEFLAKLVDSANYKRAVYVIKDLEALYKLADGDMTLIQDLLEGFLPHEISKIRTHLTNNKVNLKDYQRLIKPDGDGYSVGALARKRNKLLEYFNLDKSEFVSGTRLHNYVVEIGSIPHSKIVDGDYGRGKRR